jgi:hypothetical protein
MGMTKVAVQNLYIKTSEAAKDTKFTKKKPKTQENNIFRILISTFVFIFDFSPSIFLLFKIEDENNNRSENVFLCFGLFLCKCVFCCLTRF